MLLPYFPLFSAPASPISRLRNAPSDGRKHITTTIANKKARQKHIQVGDFGARKLWNWLEVLTVMT